MQSRGRAVEFPRTRRLGDRPETGRTSRNLRGDGSPCVHAHRRRRCAADAPPDDLAIPVDRARPGDFGARRPDGRRTPGQVYAGPVVRCRPSSHDRCEPPFRRLAPFPGSGRVCDQLYGPQLPPPQDRGAGRDPGVTGLVGRQCSIRDRLRRQCRHRLTPRAPAG